MFENKLEQEIIRLYDDNIVNLFSINQIAKLLNKTYPYINKKITELIKKGILNKIIVGRSHLCSLNLMNDKTILLLSLNEINKKNKIKTSKVKNFISENNLSFKINSVIQTKIEKKEKTIFVVENLKDRRIIEKKFKEATVLDKEELIDSILENKEIYENHVIIHGYERFFEMIRQSQLELKAKYSPINY